MSSPKPAKKPAGKKKAAEPKKDTPKKAIKKPKVLKKRTICAHKGESMRIRKLIVAAGETLEIADGGGTLVIDEIDVKKGAVIKQVFSGSTNVKIGKMNSSGSATMKF